MNDRTVEQDIASQQAGDGEAANDRRLFRLLGQVPCREPDTEFAERIAAAASRLAQRRQRRSIALLAATTFALAAAILAAWPWGEVVSAFVLSRLPAFPWPLLAAVGLAALAYRMTDGRSRLDVRP